MDRQLTNWEIKSRIGETFNKTMKSINKLKSISPKRFFLLLLAIRFYLWKVVNETNESKKPENEFNSHIFIGCCSTYFRFRNVSLNYYNIIFGRQIPQIWNPMQNTKVFGTGKKREENPKSMTSLKVNTYHIANVISNSFYDFRIISCIWVCMSYMKFAEFLHTWIALHCNLQVNGKQSYYKCTIRFMFAWHNRTATTAVLQSIIKILLWIHIDTHINIACSHVCLFIRLFLLF